MACLAAVNYDPTTAVSKATGSLLAMTAIDTTNLRLTFNAPANGIVMVRMRTCQHGTAGTASILLGVLDGSTVRGRNAPIYYVGSSSGNQRQIRESQFLVTGLTPNQSYTWDAAYAVQVINSSSPIKYGGPDNATTDNAFGGFDFSIWETTNLLAGKYYDPTVAANVSLGTLTAMGTIDTTNLRLTFNAPSSGRALVRMATLATGATGTAAQVLLGVMDGATVKGRAPATGSNPQAGAALATDLRNTQASFMVTGLTPNQSYTWDAAFGVEIALASSVLQWGGPDDTVGADAYGGFAYEIWSA